MQTRKGKQFVTSKSSVTESSLGEELSFKNLMPLPSPSTSGLPWEEHPFLRRVMGPTES